MKIDQVILIAGGLLSVLFAYIPGFKGWYDKKASDYKQLFMLLLLFVTVAGFYGASCLGRSDSFTCDVDGRIDALEAFILAIAANAGVYKATNYIGSKKPEPKS